MRARGWLLIMFGSIGYLAAWGTPVLMGLMAALGVVGVVMVFGARQVGWLLIVLGVAGLLVELIGSWMFQFWSWPEISVTALFVVAGLILRAFGPSVRRNARTDGVHNPSPRK